MVPKNARAKRVLLVDDDESVLESVALTLEDLGYEVTAMGAPENAIRILGEQSFDVLVTDIRMPRMTGNELAARAAEIQPSLDIILISAYDLEAGQGQWPTLSKPFLTGALVELIEDRAPSF